MCITKQQSCKISDEKLTELKGEREMYSCIVREFISFSAVNRTITQKISKYIEELNNTIKQHL